MTTTPSSNKLVPWLVWGGLGLVVSLILGAFILDKLRQKQLDIGRPLFIINQVSEFNMTNQLGQPVSLSDYQGKFWIADIIFTRCPGPCVYMTRRMKQLQDSLPSEWPVQLVSLTTDPDHDTPEVLRQYAQRFGADSNRWHFLTGAKPELVSLAMDDLKLVLQEKKPEERESPEDLFIHSTLLVLVDQKGQLRAAFESMLRLDEEEEEAMTDDQTKALLDKAFKRTQEDIHKALQQLMDEG